MSIWRGSSWPRSHVIYRSSPAIPRTYIFGRRTLPHPDWRALPQKGIQVLAVNHAGHGMAWDNPHGLAQALAAALS